MLSLRRWIDRGDSAELNKSRAELESAIRSTVISSGTYTGRT
jgi:hypothetical protein